MGPPRVANGHRHFVRRKGTGFRAKDVIGREHIIARSEPVAASRIQEDAEVLGVPVDRAQHPKEDLCAKEVLTIFIGNLGAQKNVHDGFDSRAAVRFIFLRRRGTCGLTEIFLRQANDPSLVARETSIEALYDENFLAFEQCDRALGRRNSVSGQNLSA